MGIVFHTTKRFIDPVIYYVSNVISLTTSLAISIFIHQLKINRTSLYSVQPFNMKLFEYRFAYALLQ